MCDVTNAKEIVEELLQVSNHTSYRSFSVDYCIGAIFAVQTNLVNPLLSACLMTHIFSSWQYLTTADFGIREELALKAAILAEKFAPDLSW
jgi:hypothetical protein